MRTSRGRPSAALAAPASGPLVPSRRMPRSLYSAAVPPVPSDPVAVIGASGALGFGLAIRLARTGVPIAIGSRDENRAQETAERARATIAQGEFSAHDNAGAVAAAQTVILSVPFRSQAETLHNLAQVLAPGQLVIYAIVHLAAAIGGKATL